MKFKINIPQDIGLIHTVLKLHNHSLFLVGGCIRDSLLTTHVKDYDLVTDALPDRVIELLKNQHFVKNILETGKAFGIVNVITIDDNEYEVATFREDSETGDGRRPDSVKFCDITTDAKRRDLTINALYYDIEKEEIIDLIDGINDLNNKVIRTVGNAEDRFNEDKLRILRAIRFAARFNSKLHPDIHHSLKRDCDLSKISNERIRDEFIKGINSAENRYYFFDLLREYSLYQYIFKNLVVDDLHIPANFDYFVIISHILRNNDTSAIYQKLNRLTYTIDEIKIIKFLISLQKLSTTSSYTFKKAQNNCNVTDEQILKFAIVTFLDKKLLETFINYKLTITGEYIMNNYQLSEGKEVGIMMESLENQLFAKLLEQKSYEKGLF